MQSQVIGERGFQFLRQLAESHGHGWAAFAERGDDDDAEERTFGWVADRINKRMLAGEAALGEGADLGLRPSCEHRTTSGRLRWRASRNCWEISAWRAGRALGGVSGDVCVASVDKSGLFYTVRVGSALSAGAALALAHALSDSGGLGEMLSCEEDWVEEFAHGLCGAIYPTPSTDEEFAEQSRKVQQHLAKYADGAKHKSPPESASQVEAK